MSVVIIIFGNSRAGKDTLAHMIQSHAGLDSHRWAFATPVKRVAMELLGMPRDVAFGDQEAKESWHYGEKTARQWLQWVGTELGRDQIDKNIWVERFADFVKEHSTCKYFIGTDGRFRNELEDLKEYLPTHHVFNVKIVRPSIDVNLDHPSEKEVYEMEPELFYTVIQNDGTLEELEKKAEDLFNKIKEDSKNTCHLCGSKITQGKKHGS